MAEKNEKKASVSDVGAWAMNISSSVAIIMTNKQVMRDSGYNFVFATSLTAFHFALTSLVGLAHRASTKASPKPVPFWDLFWFSLVSNLSIVAMNSSLMLNSVGFYQISKLSMIPVVCVLEWLLNGKTYTRQIKAAVLITMLGVGVCTVTDVKINLKGLLTAVIAVLATGIQQIFIGSLQKKYSIASFDLLSKTAPMQAASLMLFGPFVDYILTGRSLLSYSWSLGAFCFILLSCILAVFCNMSQYMCIGRFSAVTFQVLGHMKTVCILILGYLLFDSALSLKNTLGMSVAIVGMFVYQWAVEQAKIAALMKDASFSEDELTLLKSGPESKDVEGGLR